MRKAWMMAFVVCSGLCAAAQESVDINPVPADGESTVTVIFPALTAESTPALYTSAGAKEDDPCAATAANLLTLRAGVPTGADTGSTSIVLVTDKPLKEGTPICANVPGAGSSKFHLVKAPNLPPGFDWGRVRAYFTAGALTSQEHGQFSHQDMFLAFRLDKAYWTWTPQNASPKPGKQTKAPKGPWTYRPALHTYFETRLTALPVAVQSCDSSKSSCSSSSSGSGSGSGSTDTSQTQTFLNSQKSARLQFGAFLPWYWSSWKVDSKNGRATTPTHYGLFIAPLVEVGFDTTLNGLNETQQQSSTSAQVQPVNGSSQFYKFYDYGFRVGHDRLSTDSSSAPEDISYLNVGWGRFSNLASLLCPKNEYLGNNTCHEAPGSGLPWHRDYRLRVEGLLQVPATAGFSVGFSTNVGFYKKGQSDPVHIQPADDLRFLFAYKFDISKIAGKLAPQNF